jgi:hypothetical protein
MSDEPKLARFLTVAEVAKEIRMSERYVRRHLPDFRAVPMGTSVRIARIDLENWIKRQRDNANWSSDSTLLSAPRRPAPTHAPAARPSATSPDGYPSIRPTQWRGKRPKKVAPKEEG